MTARSRYVGLGIEQLGKPVLWAAKGDDVFDCSGLCTWLLKKVGGPDLTHFENAQALFNHSRDLTPAPTDYPLPGDLVFYGHGPLSVIHVAVWLNGGKVLSADGATPHINSIETAKAAKCAVHVHDTIYYRNDCPFIRVHRNAMLDDLDKVSR